MYFCASPGSKPSSPTTIIRFTFGFARPREANIRHTSFSGQISTIPNASKKVPTSTIIPPAAAKPAPGPM